MNLYVHTPNRLVTSESVRKIVAESNAGSFCLLPRHTDFLSTLVPGLLVYATSANEEKFMATDTGLLVKCGKDVFVAVRQAIQGTDLRSLRDAVESEFETIDERSRICQSAIASLEANFLRRFLEMEKRSGS